MQEASPKSDGEKRNWLESDEREFVEASVGRLGDQVIDEALLSISKNFSPEECVDIIFTVFKRIVEDPRTETAIISFVKHLQSKRQEADQDNNVSGNPM